MSSQEHFVARCLAGDVLDPSEEIDDAISAWHQGGGFGVSMESWLGMTWEEYALWVEKPYALRAILAARHTGAPLARLLEVTEGGTALAARGVPAEEFEALRRWLKQTNRI